MDGLRQKPSFSINSLEASSPLSAGLAFGVSTASFKALPKMIRFPSSFLPPNAANRRRLSAAVLLAPMMAVFCTPPWAVLNPSIWWTDLQKMKPTTSHSTIHSHSFIHSSIHSLRRRQICGGRGLAGWMERLQTHSPKLPSPFNSLLAAFVPPILSPPSAFHLFPFIITFIA